MSERALSYGETLAACAAYMALYQVIGSLPATAWLAGFRFACALVLPRRFWPALVLGEACLFGVYALTLVGSTGMGYTVLTGAPWILVCMLMVRGRRPTAASGSRASLPGARPLLAAAGLWALIAAGSQGAGEWFRLFTGELDTLSSATSWRVCVGQVLATYLTSVTLAASALALSRPRHGLGHPDCRGVSRRALGREIAGCGAMLLIGCGAYWLEMIPVPAWWVAALTLPVVVLAWRYGWCGAALGGLATQAVFMGAWPVSTLDALIETELLLAMLVSAGLLRSVRQRREVSATPLRSHPAWPP